MTLMQSSFDSLKALKEQGTQGRKNPTVHKIFNNSFRFFKVMVFQMVY